MSSKLPVSQNDLSSLAERVLGYAKSAGASSAETSVSVSSGVSVNVRLGDVETLEYQRDRGVGVTVYFGQSRGSASTADFSQDALKQTVEKACSIASFTAEDPAAGLADKELLATEIVDLDLYHEWPISPDDAIDLATECETVAREYDPCIQNSEGAAINSHYTTRTYGNSLGFIGGFSTSNHSASCAVIAGDNKGAMERDYWYSSVRDPGDMTPIREIGEIAAQRAKSRLGARKLTTRTAPVLYPARLARSLIGHFLGAISGGSQYRKSTFLLGAKGQKVFPDFLNIIENPHIPKAFGSVSIDAEGVATYVRDVVKNGVVKDYILSSYSARRLGLKTTANAGGIHNMLVDPGHLNEAQMLKEMGTGLFVTELIGQGVNSTTGDYSRGASGFWVEDGEIAYPVNEITIAGNLLDMYQRMVLVGNDVDVSSKVRCGSILLDNLMIAGD